MANPKIIDRPDLLELDAIADVEEIYEKRSFKWTSRISALSEAFDPFSCNSDTGMLKEVRVNAAGKRFVFRQENAGVGTAKKDEMRISQDPPCGNDRLRDA